MISIYYKIEINMYYFVGYFIMSCIISRVCNYVYKFLDDRWRKMSKRRIVLERNRQTFIDLINSER